LDFELQKTRKEKVELRDVTLVLPL
jgi:hypothetical protein